MFGKNGEGIEGNGSFIDGNGSFEDMLAVFLATVITGPDYKDYYYYVIDLFNEHVDEAIEKCKFSLMSSEDDEELDKEELLKRTLFSGGVKFGIAKTLINILEGNWNITSIRKDNPNDDITPNNGRFKG